jgi:hypothetical protein
VTPAAASDVAAGVQLQLGPQGVILNGQLLSPPVKDRLTRIEPLFAALKQEKQYWAPTRTTPHYDLTLADGTDPITLKSAFQTAAMSGWPRARLKMQAGAVLLTAQVPLPADHSSARLNQAVNSNIVLVVRRSETELWMSASIVAEHEPKPSVSGGLGITGATPDADPKVRVANWPTNKSAAEGSGRLYSYCGKSAPCPEIALVAANDVPVRALTDLLRVVAQVCTVAGVPECEIGYRINEPRAPGTPPDTGTTAARTGNVQVSGKLPPETIQRVVRSEFGKIRNCYEQGLGRNPELKGQVVVLFVIGKDGKVRPAKIAEGTTLADQDAKECIRSVFSGLVFPAPSGGIVTVKYPLEFQRTEQ